MKYITLKKVNDLLDEQKTRNQKYKIYKTRALASNDWEFKKVSIARRQKAEKLYTLIRQEWRLTGKELNLDGCEYTQHSPEHEKVLEKQIKCINDCKKLCKELKLNLYLGTFAHVESSRETQII